MEYSHGQHCTYLLTYHFVFVTKYRRKVLSDTVDEVIKEAANKVASSACGAIVDYNSDEDHVHMLVSLPPNTNLSTFVRTLKTQTSRAVRSKCRDEISSQLWGDSFWSESYFAATTGTVSMEAVKQYIDSQKTDSHRRKYVKKSNRRKPKAETLQ